MLTWQHNFSDVYAGCLLGPGGAGPYSENIKVQGYSRTGASG